jgi:hypothetical protein
MARERDNTAQEFETMLRRHLVQGAGRTASCGGFDAERASAYIESALTDASRLRYETHLADCASCRRAVIELRRLMPEVEIIGAPTPAPNRLAEWWDAVKQGFGAAPWRWGTLTAAGAFAIVLAFIVIPRQSDPLDRAESLIALATPAPVAVVADALADATSASEAASNSAPQQTAGASEPARPVASPAAARDRGRTPASTGTGASAGAQAATASASADNQAAGPGRTASIQGATAAEVQPAPQLVRPAPIEMMAQASPPAPAAPKNETAQASDAAAENRAEEKAGAEQTAKAEQKGDAKEDVRNQPARRSGASAFVPRRRAGGTRSVSGASQPPGDDETVRPMTRKVRDKTFRYENGRWIDAEFKPEFLPPRTRLDRDSADFERVLTEHPELKPFFDLGRVIVVWQGKVYEVRQE